MLPVSNTSARVQHDNVDDLSPPSDGSGSQTKLDMIPATFHDPVAEKTLAAVNAAAQKEKAQHAHQEQEAKAKANAELVTARTAEPSSLPEFLTPQSLVAYCDCRLTSLDSQMQQIFNQQQSNAAATNAISQVANDLNDLPAPDSSSPPQIKVTGAQANQIQNDYASAIAAAKAGKNNQLVGSLKKDLVTFLNNFRGTSSTKDTHLRFALKETWEVDASTITNLTQNLKTDGSDLNSDSQMSMINLQSLMSQQQTAVELSTNLLQTMSQTSENIASNMKAG
jgi:hypothetical protein